MIPEHLKSPSSTSIPSNKDMSITMDMNELLTNMFLIEEINTTISDTIPNDNPTTIAATTHTPLEYQRSLIIPQVYYNESTVEVPYEIHPHNQRNIYNSFGSQQTSNDINPEEFIIQTSIIHEQYSNNGHNLPLQDQGYLTVQPPHNNNTMDEIWAMIHPHHQRSDNNFATHQMLYDESFSTDDVPLLLPLNPQQHIMMPIYQPSEGQTVYENHVQQYGVYGVNHVQQIGAPSYTTNLLEVGNQLTSVNQVTPNDIGPSINNEGNYNYGGVEGDELKSNEGKRVRTDEGKRVRTDERKIKRIFKNRESAARSKARKKAYIGGLEQDVKKLKEDNARLSTQNMRVEQMLGSICTRDERPRGKTMNRDKNLRRCISY